MARATAVLAMAAWAMFLFGNSAESHFLQEYRGLVLETHAAGFVAAAWHGTNGSSPASGFPPFLHPSSFRHGRRLLQNFSEFNSTMNSINELQAEVKKYVIAAIVVAVVSAALCFLGFLVCCCR